MYKKTAVITGASSGIGMELAPIFAAKGYNLILTARRADPMHKLADDLHRMYGMDVNVIPMDLAEPHAGVALWKAIKDIEPEVDVLVNAAGFGDSGDFSGETPEVIERMIHLNISTLTSLTRYVLPGMVERKRGKILNVASLVGFQPGGPGMAVYYATKSYVLAFSRSIRRELRGTGVSVTALCPGPTRTGFEKAANAENTRLFHWTKPMEAHVVAHAAFEGLQRRRTVVIPGLLNKLLAISGALAPSAIALEVNRYLLSARR